MAFQCGFFNSVNGDRKYNAEQMTYPYARIVSDGVFASSNGNLTTDLQVVADGNLIVRVKKGDGMFRGKWGKLDTDELFTVPPANVNYNRVDSIVVRIDNTTRSGTITYKVGQANLLETPVDLIDTSDVKEYRLANIFVRANATEITQSDITDTRPTSECGIVTNLLQNSDISATYLQWQSQFYDWLNHLKETVATATIVTSLTSNYRTTVDGETIIPIQISRYAVETDILQVYINGIFLVKNVDYTINNYQSITLTLPLEKNNDVSFVVYKSVDGSDAETVVSQVNELFRRVEKLEGTKNALWSGASAMAGDVLITPTKKLTDCNNGWILVWSDFEYSTGVSSNTAFQTTVIPKQTVTLNGQGSAIYHLDIIATLNSDGTFVKGTKSLTITDSQIRGNTINIINDNNKDICLCAIYEY